MKIGWIKLGWMRWISGWWSSPTSVLSARLLATGVGHVKGNGNLILPWHHRENAGTGTERMEHTPNGLGLVKARLVCRLSTVDPTCEYSSSTFHFAFSVSALSAKSKRLSSLLVQSQHPPQEGLTTMHFEQSRYQVAVVDNCPPLHELRSIVHWHHLAGVRPTASLLHKVLGCETKQLETHVLTCQRT